MNQLIRLKDIRPGSRGSYPGIDGSMVVRGRLLFEATTGINNDFNRDIWSTDGTAEGTLSLNLNEPANLTLFANRVFLNASDSNGTELWSSDGTVEGTSLLKDITPGSSSSFPNEFTPFANRLFFTANAQGETGSELWSTDGTATGTSLVKDIHPGSSHATPNDLTVVGDQLLFWADDGSHGQELWRTDSSLQTTLVKDIRPGSGNGIGSGTFFYVMKTSLGERLLFTADDGVNGEQTWISDGTFAGTRLFKEIDGSLGFATPVGNQLFFVVERPNPVLWRTDGTPEGTRQLKQFPQGTNITKNALPGGKLLIKSTSSQGGLQLWVSNGTSAGTTLLRVINPGATGGYGQQEMLVGSKLFFTANDGSSGIELWVSDGTTAGTRLLKDISPGSSGSSPRELTAVGNQLYFLAKSSSSNIGLWGTDGTSEGTRQLKQFPQVANASDLQLTTLPNGKLLLNVTDPQGASQLWISDGSGAGTRQLANLNLLPHDFRLLANTLIFRGNDGSSGVEPWALKISEPPTAASPTLAIAPLAASKEEGIGGVATPFTFLVRRIGDASGASSALWSAAGTGSKAANGADFSGGALPGGTVRFRAGEASKTITVNVRGDLQQEGDETFTVTLSTPTGATLTTAATATATILNDDLIGSGNRNTLVGTARAEFLDGRANVDILTGGGAADVFGFRFGESRLNSPDQITDFSFGTDKIDLLTASGGTLPAPVRFIRAANNSTAKSLGAMAAAVFADANGALRGNQALGANGAALVQATNASIAGTYLLINNGVAGRSDRDDVMIKLNGFSGALPELGVIRTGSVFV